MAPHCQHEAVEGAHRGEDDEGDEPRADGDQLLRSVFTVLSLSFHDHGVPDTGIPDSIQIKL